MYQIRITIPKDNDRIISKLKAIRTANEREPLPELRKAQLEMNLQSKIPPSGLTNNKPLYNLQMVFGPCSFRKLT